MKQNFINVPLSNTSIHPRTKQKSNCQCTNCQCLSSNCECTNWRPIDIPQTCALQRKEKYRVRAYFVPALCIGSWLELSYFPPPLSTDKGDLPWPLPSLSPKLASFRTGPEEAHTWALGCCLFASASTHHRFPLLLPITSKPKAQRTRPTNTVIICIYVHMYIYI